jgi:3-deoxy-D-manno-octulosonic-acid transferase
MIIIDFIYFVYIVIVTPYYLFKFLTSKYHRQGLVERFGFIRLSSDDRSKRFIWLHAASVGEIKAAEVLIEKLRELYPNYELIISNLTPAAQKLVKEKYADIKSFFFPLDLSLIVRKVLKQINPALIILIEQELWLNLIRIGNSKKIPIVLLNGRITKHSARKYRLIKPIIRRIWNKISYFCVQNKEYFERFKTLGIKADKIIITGNMKYDSFNKLYSQKDEIIYKEIFGFNQNDLVVIGGSTHNPEEELLLEAYSGLKKNINNLRLIIAPRHPFRFDEVEKLIKTKGFECLRRSTILKVNNRMSCNADSAIILLDTVGELSRVYSISDVVVVGGSFVPRGGQSILEPASLGKPVIFGPDMSNFQEIADLLIKENAAISVIDQAGLYQQLNSLFKDSGILKKMGERARSIINRYQGATERNIKFINNLLTV